MQAIIYRLFTILYPLAIRLASPFNHKARQWIAGRKNLLQNIQKQISAADKLIWMHCASLGEFEQGRPLLEQLRQAYPVYKILLTFFSPSGYEVTKGYSGADYVFYLPMDGPANARNFLKLTNPQLIVFVKYEFWYYYLTEARQRQIPLLLISGIFRKDQPFFHSYGNLHRKMLSCFMHVFVQNNHSVQLLKSLDEPVAVTLAGDTRFDRVDAIAKSFKPVTFFEQFCKGAPVIVAGSTWPEDDKELAHYANSNRHVRFIIAPHSIIEHRLKDCLSYYHQSVLYSQVLQNGNNTNTNIVIIDNIGMLSTLYNYSTIAYVGGAFGADGVHNVLEPAVFGKPVVFGPEFEKYHEAVELVETGGAITVENILELEEVFNDLLINSERYTEASKASANYVQGKKGSTEKIMEFIYENRLLTN